MFLSMFVLAEKALQALTAHHWNLWNTNKRQTPQLPKPYLSPSTKCCSQPLCEGPACVNVTDCASVGALIASYHGSESVPWSREK